MDSWVSVGQLVIGGKLQYLGERAGYTFSCESQHGNVELLCEIVPIIRSSPARALSRMRKPRTSVETNVRKMSPRMITDASAYQTHARSEDMLDRRPQLVS